MKSNRFGSLLVVLLVVQQLLNIHTVWASSVYGEDSTSIRFVKRKYVTQRITQSPPNIDGALTDPCWNEGTWSGGYRQFMPKEGDSPSMPTEIKVLFDDKNIYVAIRAYDDPDLIDRQKGRRDNFSGDIVGVCFDSYFDHRTGFEFDLTASGSKIDLILMNDGWDTNWNPIWYGEVGQEDSAWTAEMQIPLSQLRYDDKTQQVWGMHAWRWVNRNQEEDQWNLMPRDNPGMLYSIGEIHGISNLPKNRRIELLPYGVSKYHTFDADPQNPFTDGKNFDYAFGLDGKIGLSSNFTLDFTVNPDFGQVEADPSTLNLSAFETFYEEKRPFFLEGKNITDFDLGNNLLFYSRRIGHTPSYSPNLDDGEFSESPGNTTILGAIKMTGKNKKGLSVGIIESLTGNEFVKISRGEDTEKVVAEPVTNYFVTRIQKDINGSNTILGGIFTSTNRLIDDDHLNFMNRQAYTGGFDLRHHWKDKTYYVDIKSIGSYVEGHAAAITSLQESSSRYYNRPDADYLDLDTTRTTLSGFGGHVILGKGSNGRWRYSGRFSWLSPGLELNDMGYMPQADELGQGAEISYVVSEPVGILRNYDFSFYHETNWNFNGERLGMSAAFNGSALFENKWGVFGRIMRRGDSYSQTLLRGGPTTFQKGFWDQFYRMHSDESKKLSFSFGYHGHIYDDNKSLRSDFHPGFTLRLTNALKLQSSVDYNINKDMFQYVTHIEKDGQDKYITAFLDQKTLGMTIRLDYTINPDFTIQYYGNPYLSVGRYSEFKDMVHARSENYSTMFNILDVYNTDEEKSIYHVDVDKDGIEEYAFDNPDFNFRQFQSNLVARWEYKPGSTLFIVWSHARSASEKTGNFSLARNADALFDNVPDNIFLLKLNYWFSL